MKTETQKAVAKIFFIITILTLTTVSCRVEQAQALSPKIEINVTPPIINADGETHEIITIELRTFNDQPYIAPMDIPVQLTSSNLDVGTIQTFATIEKGKIFTKASFTTKKNSGITILTATTPGFETSQAYLQVLRSNYDANLGVFASPRSMPAKVGAEGVVTVQLLDSNGSPFRAIDDIEVVLTSSNHSVCTVTKDVTISKGDNYVTTTFRVTGENSGESLISAQAQGFGPGNDLVRIFNTTAKPSILALFFGPESLLPDQSEHESVHVELQDETGNPQPAESTITVYLSSSNTNIATIEESITINAGEYKATGTLTTYDRNGDSIITAQSPGFYPDSEVMSIKGQVPSILGLNINPNVMISDGSSNDIVTVQVLDDEGNPVEVGEDTTILLSSSNSDVGTVPDTVTIEAGKSYATVPFTSQGASGDVIVIASAMGVAPQEASLFAITLGMNATLITPISIRINQTFIAEVQILSGGQPVPDATVDWSALGGVIQQKDDKTNSEGISQAQIVQKYDQLRLKTTVSKIGYESVEEIKNIQITQDIEQNELTVTFLGRTFKVFHILIALAVVIAIAMGIYVYIKYKSSQNDEPEDLEIYT